EADPTAVLEEAFGREVAAFDGLAETMGLAEAGVAVVLAVLDRGLRTLLVVQDEVDGEPRAVGPLWIGHVGAIAHEIAARRVGHGLPPASGNADGEGRDGHELLVALAADAPHEDGEAAGLVEHGEPVVPGVGLVGDALPAGGDEGPDARKVGA